MPGVIPGLPLPGSAGVGLPGSYAGVMPGSSAGVRLLVVPGSGF